MLVAYRPYSQLDEGARPVGVVLQTPWTREHIADSDATAYRDNGWTVLSLAEYEALETSLIPINAHAMALASIKSSVLAPAVSFGELLMNDFTAENILLGITQYNMTAVVLERMNAVVIALQTGSLYDAVLKVRQIPQSDYDAIFITAPRLLAFINKVETYLGLPLSTSVIL
jgi:hypothetical protein